MCILKKSLEDKCFPCEECGRTYKHKKSLLMHRRFECGKEAQFQCLYCPYKAKQKGNLKAHMFFKHQRVSE